MGSAGVRRLGTLWRLQGWFIKDLSVRRNESCFLNVVELASLA